MLFAPDTAALSAAAIATGVARRQIRPRAMAEAALGAIERLDPTLHAFVTVAPEQVLAAADAIERRLERGEPVGPLAGVPVAIKDLVFTAGLRTTFGSRLYADFVPEEDDIVVARLRQADALILGKTNVAEFGFGGVGHNRLFPTTRNPHALGRTPGGSSAGSAAAVAAGICPLAIGSDGGGSVRIPASFTGIVGFKPSMGRVPLWPGCRDERFPGASGWESIEHLGPMARSVADVALMLDVIAGPDGRDRFSLPRQELSWSEAARRPPGRGLRIGYCRTWAGLPVDPSVAAVIDAAAARIEADLGHRVEVVASPFGDLIEAFRVIVALDTDRDGLRALARGREHDLGPQVRRMLAGDPSAGAMSAALMARKAAVNAMARFMLTVDVLISPTVPVAAFPIDRDGPGTINGVAVADDAWSPFSYPTNLTGQPSISVPAGMTAEGLPVGLQISGRHLEDGLVLSLASAFEHLPGTVSACRRMPVGRDVPAAL